MATQHRKVKNYWAWNENINGRHTKCNSIYNNVSISNVVNDNFRLIASLTTPNSFLNWQGFIGGPRGAFWMGLNSGKWCVGKQYGKIEEFCHFGDAEKNKRCEIKLVREGNNWNFYIDDIFIKSVQCQRSDCIQTQQVTIGAGYDNGNEPWNGGVHFITICPLEDLEEEHNEEKKDDFPPTTTNNDINSAVEPDTSNASLAIDDLTISVSIKTLTNETMIYEMQPNDTVKMIKNKIFTDHKILPLHQRLIYAGDNLEDQNTLDMLGITDDALFYMVLTTTCSNDSKSEIITVGDKVARKFNNGVGIVLFIGEIPGKIGIFYGIDLEQSNGKNDGSYNNRYYFKTDEQSGVFVRKNKINLLSTNNVDMSIRVTVGDIVYISKYESKGIVRFIGETEFKPDIIWYGVQLERSNGKNNGTIDGVKYFQLCSSKYGNNGIFVQLSSIKLIKHNNNKLSRSSSFGLKKSKKSTKKNKRCVSSFLGEESGQKWLNKRPLAALKDDDEDHKYKDSDFELKSSYSSSSYCTVRKLGPRDIGRIKYKGTKYDNSEHTHSFLKEKRHHRSLSSTSLLNRNKPAPAPPILTPSKRIILKKLLKAHDKDIGDVNQFELIYRGSRDTFDWEEQSQIVKGSSKTLTLIQTTTNNVFGGYTEYEWGSVDSGEWIEDENAFLVLLRSSANYPPNLYPIKESEISNAVQEYEDCLCIFGTGGAIYVESDCNLHPRHGEVNDDTSYDHPGGYHLNGGKRNFKVKQYEVWQCSC